jgi:electron transport complex protein RnfC
LPGEKAATGGKAIEKLPAAGRLTVAMCQHAGPASRPCVETGQRVLAGQVIGDVGSVAGAVLIHAPTSGRVAALVKVDTPHGCDVPAVEIDPDGLNEWVSPGDPDRLSDRGREPKGADEPPDIQSLIERVAQSGIAGLGPDGSAAAQTLATALQKNVRHLIINGVESEPYLTAEYRILFEHGRLVIRTADLIARLLKVQRSWLAVDRANATLIRELRRLSHGTPLRIASLPTRYPQSAVPLVTLSVVGREVPYGGTPLDIGTLVLDTPTLFAIAQAIYHGRPCVSRIVTVAGDAAARPGNYEIALGTSLRQLIDRVGLGSPLKRIVVGGPMTGLAADSPDMVTTRRTAAVLLLSARQVAVRRPGPCIRCGWCLEDCPVGLDPPGLLEAVESLDVNEIARLLPHACLDCGICSFVCPAALPLAEGAARARTYVTVSA